MKEFQFIKGILSNLKDDNYPSNDQMNEYHYEYSLLFRYFDEKIWENNDGTYLCYSTKSEYISYRNGRIQIIQILTFSYFY